jgi:methoxymalonate biosynthesis acyl carrier protein
VSATSAEPARPEQRETRLAIEMFIAGRFPTLEISGGSDIFRAGFVNSLFLLEMVQFVENLCGTKVPRRELSIDNFRTIDNLVVLTERLRGQDS